MNQHQREQATKARRQYLNSEHTRGIVTIHLMTSLWNGTPLHIH